MTLTKALDHSYVHDARRAITFQCFRNAYDVRDSWRLLDVSNTVLVEKHRYIVDIDHERDR